MVLAVRCDNCWVVEIWDAKSKRVQHQTDFFHEVHCFSFVQELHGTEGERKMGDRLLIGVDNSIRVIRVNGFKVRPKVHAYCQPNCRMCDKLTPGRHFITAGCEGGFLSVLIWMRILRKLMPVLRPRIHQTRRWLCIKCCVCLRAAKSSLRSCFWSGISLVLEYREVN